MKTGRRIRWKRGTIAGICLIVLVAVAAADYYLERVRDAVQKTTVASVQELAIHDRKSLSAKVEDLWSQLDAVFYRTQNSGLESIQQICDGMHLEWEAGQFDNFYLLDENGKTYSNSNVIQDRSTEEYVKRLLAGERQIALRYEPFGTQDYGDERIIYGVRGEEPFTCDGVTFVGVLGITRSETIRNTLEIGNFDGKGYTAIIDRYGNYLLNRDWRTGITVAESYFEILYRDSSLNETEISNIRRRLHDKEIFTVQYSSETFGPEIAIFYPMDKTDWSIIMSVPESVLSSQTNEFVRLASILIGAMFLLLASVFAAVLRFMSETISAKAESKAKEEFVASMSHEIRTPLNSIISLNALMRKHVEEPKMIEKYLNKLDVSARYLLTLINDVLDMAKLQADKIDLDNKPFSMERLVSETEAIIAGTMERRKIDFRTEKEILYSGLIGDSVRIQQILINILGNASKFTPPGGKVILRVRQTKTEDGTVESIFEVEDTGAGMSREFLGKIFNAFEQERNHVSDGMHGTGLGMPISYMLAKQMGGDLSVVSELNKGSCFTLKLVSPVSDTVSEARPETKTLTGKMQESVSQKEISMEEISRSEISQEGISQQETSQEDISRNKEKKHILVAEDNELNAELLMELLECEGCTSVHAADGQQVVDVFAESEPFTFDLILMDVQMPVRNGYQATELIRAMNRPDAKTVRIFACTANAMKQDRELALECGMNDFVTKPIDIEKLMEKLNPK